MLKDIQILISQNRQSFTHAGGINKMKSTKQSTWNRWSLIGVVSQDKNHFNYLISSFPPIIKTFFKEWSTNNGSISVLHFPYGNLTTCMLANHEQHFWYEQHTTVMFVWVARQSKLHLMSNNRLMPMWNCIGDTAICSSPCSQQVAVGKLILIVQEYRS